MIDAPLKKRQCPVCEVGILALKDGKYGWFWGCSNFPKCKHTESHNKRSEYDSDDSNNHVGEWYEELMWFQDF